MLLGIGGLGLVLCVDLISFLFAVLTLIFFVKIPEVIKNNEETSFAQLITSMLDSLLFLKKEKETSNRSGRSGRCVGCGTGIYQ